MNKVLFLPKKKKKKKKKKLLLLLLLLLSSFICLFISVFMGHFAN